MHKRAYLGLGFLLALGILVLGAFTGSTALAQTPGGLSVTVPGGGGQASLPGGGNLTFAPGAVPAGSTATVTPLAAPPPGTTLPGVGNVYDFRVTGPNGEAITSFAGRVTVTGTGNACFLLNEATGRFEPIQGTPIGGGQIECVVPRPGVVAIVTVLGAQATPTAAPPRPTPVGAGVPAQAPGQAPGQGPGKAGAAPGQAPGKAGAAPAQAPGKAGAAPAQAPGKAGAAPAQAPSALPRTGEEFPVGALALAGLTLAGIGVATRRFIRRK